MSPPAITVSNRQRAAAVGLAELRVFAEAALAECLKVPARPGNVLGTLSDVSVVLVSDRRIGELHRRFLGEAGATDVITFQHGEIVISVETARRQAGAFGTTLEHELRLYIVHGFLHLRGLDDKSAAGAAEMKRLQEKLVASLL
jgi:probable rRNA maturation factor